MKKCIEYIRTKGKYLCLGCILLGIVIIGAGFAMAGFDVYAMQSVQHEPLKTVTKTLEAASLHTISIDAYESIITVEPSMDDHIHISYQENKEYPVEYEQSGTALEIKRKTPDIFQNGFSIRWFDVANDQRARIRIQLPAQYTGKVKLENSYADVALHDVHGLQEITIDNEQGDISMRNVSAQRLHIDSSYDEVTLENIECKDEIQATIEQGNMEMDQVTSNSMKLKAEYGLIRMGRVGVKESINMQGLQTDMDIDELNAGDMTLNSEYGELQLYHVNITKSAQFDLEQSEIQLQQLACEALSMESDYGDIQIKKLIAPSIYIHAEQGSIKAAIDESMKHYDIRSAASYGDNNLPSKANKGASKKLEITTEYGDINVDFLK